MKNFKQYLKEGREWKAVDFDATLAHYTHWKGATKLGKPVPKMLQRVKKWIANGEKVKIFTARADKPEAVKAIQKWLVKNGLPALEVTNVKDRFMTEIWDDRARQVEKNTGRLIGAEPEETIEEGLKDILAAGLIGASSMVSGHNANAENVTKTTMTAPEQSNIKHLLARKLIIKHEGIENKVYKDTKSIPTIGIGFNLQRKDAPNILKAVGADYKNILSGKESLNQQQINKIFNYTFIEATELAEKLMPNFKDQPSDVQAVLIDMAFNLGPKLGEFKRFLKAVEEKNYDKASKEMINSQWYKQVGNRSKNLVNIIKNISYQSMLAQR